MQLSDDARLIAGILLITVPTIEFGGVFLLRLLRNSERGYADNPLRQNLFRAGHAHAGVLVILSLVMQLLVDSLSLAAPVAWIARLGVPAVDETTAIRRQPQRCSMCKASRPASPLSTEIIIGPAIGSSRLISTIRWPLLRQVVMRAAGGVPERTTVAAAR